MGPFFASVTQVISTITTKAAESQRWAWRMKLLKLIAISFERVVASGSGGPQSIPARTSSSLVVNEVQPYWAPL